MKTMKLIFVFIFVLILAACGNAREANGLYEPEVISDNGGEPQNGGEEIKMDNRTAELTLAGLTSWELVQKMGAGWNIGNSLDAHWNESAPWREINRPQDQEVLWGNPATTFEMLKFVKDAGFDTVRIPITWYIHTGEGPEYIIDEAWMDRVQEIVDYVMELDMFAIINIHHDEYRSGRGWSNGWFKLYHFDGDNSRPLTNEEKAGVDLRFRRLWEQIAERFKDYDERLIFEGINEPRTVAMHGHTRDQWNEVGVFLNELLQTFVDTVRASGGRNGDRHLMVTPYFASVGMATNDRYGRISTFINRQTGELEVTDPRGRLIVSLHYYEPWGFVTAPADSQWHSYEFDLSVGSVAGNINDVYRILRENFIRHGVPVIMGETGAIARTMPNGESNEAERVKWAHHFIGGLAEMGVPTIIWDDGGDFRLLDRNRLEWVYPDLVRAIVEASQK
jgi:endoglucanase